MDQAARDKVRAEREKTDYDVSLRLSPLCVLVSMCRCVDVSEC